MRREERRALRMIERDAERKASIDPLVEGRARGRDCGDCGGCDGIPPCGWRQGLLLENHAPHNVGVILGAVMLPSGDPITRITELWDWRGGRENCADPCPARAAYCDHAERGDRFGPEPR